MVKAGATVHVAAGIYESSKISSHSSGTSTARIVYISDEKWGAKLKGLGADIVWENDGDYVDIRDFDVAGDSAARIGLLNRGTRVRFIGNHVHDIPATGCSGDGGAGIDNYGESAAASDVIGNWIYGIGDFTKPCPRVHGIYQSTVGGNIWNNVVFRTQGWGIHLYGFASNVVVANNTVFSNGYGGIVVAGGSSKVNDYTLVSNNLVYMNGLVKGADGFGIEEFGSSVGGHNRYLNNLVFKNGPGDWDLQGKNPFRAILAEPQFVSFRPDGSGDYHLLASSPAIDSGTSEGAPLTDFDGKPRPSGAGFDIGAFEYQR